MPYKTDSALPDSVKNNLPRHAQDIYRATFNNALKEYSGKEETAHKVAWAAVKKEYGKKGGEWVKKSS